MLRDSIITIESLNVIINVLKRAMILDAESTLSIVNLLLTVLNDSMKHRSILILRSRGN